MISSSLLLTKPPLCLSKETCVGPVGQLLIWTGSKLQELSWSTRIHLSQVTIPSPGLYVHPFVSLSVCQSVTVCPSIHLSYTSCYHCYMHLWQSCYRATVDRQVLWHVLAMIWEPIRGRVTWLLLRCSELWHWMLGPWYPGGNLPRQLHPQIVHLLEAYNGHAGWVTWAMLGSKLAKCCDCSHVTASDAVKPHWTSVKLLL